MKKRLMIILLGLMAAGCNSTLLNKITGDSQLPAGAIQTGTLGNEVLLQDALLPAMVQASAMGCDKVISFKPFVAQLPSGNAGSRIWKELWQFSCQNGKKPLVKMTFTETAKGVSFAASS